MSVTFGLPRMFAPSVRYVPPPGEVMVFPASITQTGMPAIRIPNGHYIPFLNSRTSGIQEALNWLVDSHYGEGTIRLAGDCPIQTPVVPYSLSSDVPTLQAKLANKTFDFLGSGTEGAILSDETSSGLMWDFDLNALGAIDFRYNIKDLKFQGKQNKPTQVLTRFRNRTAECTFENVQWSAKPDDETTTYKYKALAYFDNIWQLSLRDPKFTNVIGIGLWCDSTSNNGGNYSLQKAYFQSCKVGMFMQGGATTNSFHLSVPKWIAEGASAGWPDHVRLTSLSTFAAGNSQITIGTGHTLAAGDPIYIGNDDWSEVHIIASYAPTTGITTLDTPLVNDFRTAPSVEIIAGGALAFVTGPSTPCISMSSPHFEACACVLNGCPSMSLESAIIGSSPLLNSMGQQQEYGFYCLGKATSCKWTLAEWRDNRLSAGRGDSYFIRAINSESAVTGSSNVGGPYIIEDPQRNSGGGSISPAAFAERAILADANVRTKEDYDREFVIEDVSWRRKAANIWETADDVELSRAGGKTTLSLPSTSGNTGLTIGGDTTLYRAGAGSLVTDGAFTAQELFAVIAATIGVRTSVPADGTLSVSSVQLYVDEAASPKELKVKWKDSGGVVRTQVVCTFA